MVIERPLSSDALKRLRNEQRRDYLESTSYIE